MELNAGKSEHTLKCKLVKLLLKNEHAFLYCQQSVYVSIYVGRGIRLTDQCSVGDIHHGLSGWQGLLSSLCSAVEYWIMVSKVCNYGSKTCYYVLDSTSLQWWFENMLL